MTLFRSLMLLASLTILAGCQTPMQSGSQCTMAPGSMAAYNSFAWRSDPAIDLVDDTGYVSPLVIAGLQNAVEDLMKTKGFTKAETPEAADLALDLTLRTRRELVSFETGGQVCADTSCWEKANTGMSTRMDVRTIGFLAADVYLEDAAVWRGWVETTLYPSDRDNSSEVVERALPKLFETFPP